jgi:predicted ester cyclase
MTNEEKKALACCLSEAINTKQGALLDEHPGYWQFRSIFPFLMAAFPDAHDTIEQQTIEGEWVTTRSTLRGTHLGPFMGLAPSDQQVKLMTICLDQIVDGRIVEHFAVADWASALQTMGLIPPAPSRLPSDA